MVGYPQGQAPAGHPPTRYRPLLVASGRNCHLSLDFNNVVVVVAVLREVLLAEVVVTPPPRSSCCWEACWQQQKRIVGMHCCCRLLLALPNVSVEGISFFWCRRRLLLVVLVPLLVLDGDGAPPTT